MLALALQAELIGSKSLLVQKIKRFTDAGFSVTDLSPLDTTEEPYYYTFKVQCTSCREIHPNWVSLSRFVSYQGFIRALVHVG